MRGSDSARRIDAGGVDPRRCDLRDAPLFRVRDPLSRVNANWTDVAERIVGRSYRKPGKAKPFWILGGVTVSLLVAGGIGAWHRYARPRIEQEMAHLGGRLADAINIDCSDAGNRRLPDKQPACR